MTHFKRVPQLPYARIQKFEAAYFFNLIFKLKTINLHYHSPQGQHQECETRYREVYPHLKIQLLSDVSVLDIHFFKLW